MKKLAINKLPPILKEEMTMELSEQLSITLFPKKERSDQPDVDVIRLNLIQIEGDTKHVYMTPCEALEISAGLSSAVQFFLYNQEQYRKDILQPRLKIAAKRAAKTKKNVDKKRKL